MLSRLKYFYQEDGKRLTVENRAWSDPGDFLYPVILLFFWGIGVFLLYVTFAEKPEIWEVLYLIILSLLWLGFGALSLFLLAWRVLGKEIVEVDAEKVKIGRKIGPWENMQTFSFEEVDQLNPNPDRSGFSIKKMIGYFFETSGGSIEIKTRYDNHLFGKSLSKKQSRDLVKAINEFNPHSS